MKKLKFIPAVIASLFLVATSCQTETLNPDDSRPPSANGKGTMKVSMTDNPGNFEQLNVEIERVEVYNETSGWVELNTESQMVSVLDLTNGAQVSLNGEAGTELAAGNYTMVKLDLGTDKNELVVDGTVGLNGIFVSTSNLVELEYQGPDEVIIEIDQNVEANQESEILLDFDVAASVKQKLTAVNDFILQPVITEIADASTGIRGEVTGTADAMVKLSGPAGAFSTFINASGEFLIRGMEAGEYDLEVIPELVEGDLVDAIEPIRIENVLVAEGMIRTLSTIDASGN